MIHEHNEIEAKLAAEDVTFDEFVRFVMTGYSVKSYVCITGPDHYFENGPNVVRHRIKLNSNTHELTVKRRKSEGSTRDREEIDLHFGDKTKPEDVEAFLRGVGFVEVFQLKKTAHIFWVQLTPSLEATFVIYDVWRTEADEEVEGTKKRFIEVEAEKGSAVTVETAKRHINSLVRVLQSEFRLGEPLNESLYEIYSGRRYQSV